MAICINKNGDIFEKFINISENEVNQENYKYPITHALVVAKNKKGYLLAYNVWRNNWELAGGIIENGETMRECAAREMKEETNQIAKKMEFRGLMRFKLKNGKIEYGGLFNAKIETERPFIKNKETNKIVFWNGVEDIGYINEIDKKLLEYYK
jgi:8-oxo-dGTP diphosphatase